MEVGQVGREGVERPDTRSSHSLHLYTGRVCMGEASVSV